jgi:hypothetical protein
VQSPIVKRDPKKRVQTAPKTAVKADRVLRVETYKGIWARASIGDMELDVPGAKFRLAPGTYTVRLRNTDMHVTRTCTVTLGVHEVTTLRVAMEEGGCDIE